MTERDSSNYSDRVSSSESKLFALCKLITLAQSKHKYLTVYVYATTIEHNTAWSSFSVMFKVIGSQTITGAGSPIHQCRRSNGVFGKKTNRLRAIFLIPQHLVEMMYIVNISEVVKQMINKELLMLKICLKERILGLTLGWRRCTPSHNDIKQASKTTTQYLHTCTWNTQTDTQDEGIYRCVRSRGCLR